MDVLGRSLKAGRMAGLNPFSTSLVILQECDITFLRGVMRHSQTCRRLVTKNEKIVCDPQTKSCWRLASCWESFRLSRHPTQRAYRYGRPIPGTRRRRRYGAWPGVHTGILQLRVDLSVVCRCHTCGARLGHTQCAYRVGHAPLPLESPRIRASLCHQVPLISSLMWNVATISILLLVAALFLR